MRMRKYLVDRYARDGHDIDFGIQLTSMDPRKSLSLQTEYSS